MHQAPTPPTERIPIAYGYGRVTSHRQKESGLSLAEQRDRLERYYKFKLEPDGLRWGGSFIDGGISAYKKPLAQRKAGGELLARLKPGDHIIITRLDRAFRRVADASARFEQWRTQGLTVHVLDLGVDTSTSTGRMLIHILASIAEFERELASERTAAVIARRKPRRPDAPKNQNVGYGFKLVGAIGRKRVVPDKDERRLMAAIVELHDEKQLDFQRIYFEFLRRGFKRKDGREWSLTRIKRAYDAELALRQPLAQATSADSTCTTPATD